jgi:hypothetical protein
MNGLGSARATPALASTLGLFGLSEPARWASYSSSFQMLAVFRQRGATFSFYRTAIRAKVSISASATFELSPFSGRQKIRLGYFGSA